METIDINGKTVYKVYYKSLSPGFSGLLMSSIYFCGNFNLKRYKILNFIMASTSAAKFSLKRMSSHSTSVWGCSRVAGESESYLLRRGELLSHIR